MKIYLIAYGVTAAVFLVIDAIWLSTMTQAFYRPFLGEQLADQPRLTPAIIFYLIYVLAIIFFAVGPALQSGQWTTALINGAFFGFAAYATYDLTNQATLKSWPTIVTLVDLGWGIVVTGASATIGYWITSLIQRS